jgi:hypothetical protein
MTAPLDLYWRVDGESITDFVAFLHLVDMQGKAQLTNDTVPLKTVFPPTQWQKGEVVREQRELVLPEDLPPGLYRLEFGLYRWPGVVPVLGQEAGADGKMERFVLGTVKVPVSQADASQVQHSSVLDYGGLLSLWGYSLSAETVRPGENLSVTLFWRSLRSIGEDYVVSLQLMAPDGRLVAQADGPPAQGRYPTSIWEEQETVVDQRQLRIPVEVPQGEYQLAVVVYGSQEQKRLAVSGQGSTTPLDTGLLRRILVER